MILSAFSKILCVNANIFIVFQNPRKHIAREIWMVYAGRTHQTLCHDNCWSKLIDEKNDNWRDSGKITVRINIPIKRKFKALTYITKVFLETFSKYGLILVSSFKNESVIYGIFLCVSKKRSTKGSLRHVFTYYLVHYLHNIKRYRPLT